MDTVPPRMKKHIKKLVADFNLYTNHLSNPAIPKTTNQVEPYYRHTDPQKMKRQYKTSSGLIQALSQKAVHWIIRNGFISEDVSLHIARHYLGKQYNKANISNVFSKKKKHVLTYWMGDPTQ
jgi:hypothetical protein